MKRTRLLAIAVAVALAVASAPQVDAKGGFSSSRSSSSSGFKSFSPKPSSPVRMPSAPSAPRAAAPTPSPSQRPASFAPSVPTTGSPSAKPLNTNYQASSQTKSLWDRTPAAKPAAPKAAASTQAKSVLGQAQERKTASDSYQAYQQRTAKFQQPSTSRLDAKSVSSSPVAQAYRPARTVNVTYTDYYRGRDSYYAGRSWVAPTYVYHGAPSYGAWDALFLYSMLDSIQDQQMMRMMHNQANDPGVREWRRELEEQAKTNGELRAKLDAMDKEVEKLKSEPVDPTYVPANVPREVALAAEAVVGGGDGSIRMGTGSGDGVYFAFCMGDGRAMKGLANLTTGKVTCDKTSGSEENIEGLASGKFDAILVQADALSHWQDKHPETDVVGLQATAYAEYVQLVVNAKSGVESIKDLDPSKHTIYLAGSGARQTWDGFVHEDPSYKVFGDKGRLKDALATEETLAKVAAEDNAVMLFVGGLHAPLLNTANNKYGDRLELAPVDDWDFNNEKDKNGTPIYAFETIPKGLYPKLQERGFMWGSNAVETIVVPAVFVLSQRWVDANGADGQAKLETVLAPALSQAQERAVAVMEVK